MIQNKRLPEFEYYLSLWKLKCIFPHEERDFKKSILEKEEQILQREISVILQVIWFSKADHTRTASFMGILRNMQAFYQAEIFTVQLSRTETHSGVILWSHSVNRSNVFQFHPSANSDYHFLSPCLLFFQEGVGVEKGKEKERKSKGERRKILKPNSKRKFDIFINKFHEKKKKMQPLCPPTYLPN